MQSLAAKASVCVSWERVELGNGVYRIDSARFVESIPDISGWVDCTGLLSFQSDLDEALVILGITRSDPWMGVASSLAAGCVGMAWPPPSEE